MRKSVIFWMLLPLCGLYAQHPASFREYQKVFTTYPFSDPNPIPLLGPVYPYGRFDGFTSTPVEKSWKVVELENDYISLMILPEIGGKIWSATEKSTNQPFLYYNHVIKFRDVAMRGPWTSGGLESNFGIIGHTPNCSTPVDYMVVTNADGSVSCFIGALDLLSRSNWRVEINLPKDKAYFTTRAFWYNGSELEEPYYHWMNAGLKVKGNLEFIYPGTSYLGHEGEHADWPLNKSNGHNISFYEQNNFGGYKSYHVFGKYTDFAGAYWHQDDFGMVRYGTHDDKAGKKIWIWGLSGQGMIWEKLLTDHDGQYFELQSGRRFNQNSEQSSLTPFKQTSFEPYGSDGWKEYWYPVLHTKGISVANEYGALNLKAENGWLKIYFSPVQALSDTLVIREGSRIIYRKFLELQPMHTWSDSLQIADADKTMQAVFTGNKLRLSMDPLDNALSRPLETPGDFDWQSVYGRYLLGRDAMSGKSYREAELKLGEALQKDPNYLPALSKMAELMYRNMRYTEALAYASHALSIDTYDGAANYYYGLINLQLGNMADAKDGFDIAALSQPYRSAAYAVLARIYFRESSLGKASVYALKALEYNRTNMEALQLRALIYRYQANSVAAGSVLDSMAALDPLNHFVRFERYLWSQTAENRQVFLSQIRNEMPQETLLELGIWYYRAGCPSDALQLFNLNKGSVEAQYWISFLQKSPLDISGLDPNLFFPFRSETALVIEQLRKREDSWQLRYQLALIYQDRNRLQECRDLLNSCGDEPGFAPFYAVRASICRESAGSRSADDLKRALSLDNQWRYHKLLAEYYISVRQFDSALQIAGPYYLGHPDQYIMGMLYAKTLLLNKKYSMADKVLTRLQIIPFEGATEGRELYREAKLMQAVGFLEQKKYASAQAMIRQSMDWPENLGVGKPYEADIDVRLEDWIAARCYLATGNKEEAQQRVDKIIAFSPRVENTIRNFIPANALVTAWAFELKGQREEGRQFLEAQARKFPSNIILPWALAVFEKNADHKLEAQQMDANARILERLMDSNTKNSH